VSQNTFASPKRKSRKIASRISQDSMRLKNSFGFLGFCSDNAGLLSLQIEQDEKKKGSRRITATDLQVNHLMADL
jgi:hypothetical protein